jgi:uncharacterized membrane protein
MSISEVTPQFLTSLKEVFLLFVIPIGGGIPAGVVLAKNRGLHWGIMLILYFFSDVVLACVFEPIMLMFVRASEKIEFLSKVRKALVQTTTQTVSKFGLKPRPFSIVVITFGTDPMTGRVVSKAAGHGFFVGWLLTIIGDMFYFSVLMVSTLWLSDILGDGTWTVIIIMVLMMVVLSLVRRVRKWWAERGGSS